MTLRTKILIGYLIFIAIFVAANGWSASRLDAMSDLSRRIIAENYDSVVAAQQMKESLERQDAAATDLLLRQGDPERQLAESRTKFDAALEGAKGNITEPGEADAITAIKRERDENYRLVDAFWKQASPDPDSEPEGVGFSYFYQLRPSFDRLRVKCQQLLDLNQTAMRAKSQTAAKIARSWFLSTVVADILLLLLAAYLAVKLSRYLVRPLSQLRATTTKIAGGDLDARVDINSHDEVGLLGAEFNRMAERIRQLRQTDLGQVILAQQTTEAAIDSLSDPVVVTDTEGQITKLNHAAEELFGREAGQTGKPIGTLTADPRFAAAISQTLQSQRPVDLAGAAAVMVPHGGANGAEHAFHLRATPMRDNDGHLLGAVTVLEDITQAQENDRVKTDFIKAASEQLRTPLTKVEVGLHLILENSLGALNEKQTEVLQSCREDCVRLDHLLRELLDLSHIESGGSVPQPVRIDAGQMLTAVGETVRAQIEAKRIDLVVSAPANLPMMWVDRMQLDQIVTQLIKNALRHTPVRGEIGLSARLQGTELAIEVSNTGEGIPREHQDRVFDKFFQVPGTPAGHAGLGLTIAKQLVEQNGGQISVRSEPGRGATFTFTVPVAVD